MATILSIRNFEQFVHYNNRRIVWVKLHCSMLDDFEWSHLSDVARFQLTALVLLAARLGNQLPDDEQWLRTKISSNEELKLDELMVRGFIERIEAATVASETASPVASTGASPEQNRTEEMRKEKTASGADAQRFAASNGELHPSRFSYDECMAYVRHQITIGKQVTNPVGLALTLMRDGSADASINKFITEASNLEKARLDATVNRANA